MNVSRRTFLAGVLTMTAVAVLPMAKDRARATIWADGVHDDTDGLQALFDGEPVNVMTDGVVVRNVGGDIFIGGGNFIVSKTLYLQRTAPKSITRIDNCRFNWAGEPEGYFFRLPKTTQVELEYAQ